MGCDAHFGAALVLSCIFFIVHRFGAFQQSKCGLISLALTR